MYTNHPWHSVSPGKDAPQYVNAIIEIPRDGSIKYELDKESGLLRLDRVLYSSVMYPANYGFIPRTIADDGDPMDILVICSIEVFPLSIVEAKVIGVMHMIDNGERDEKIIAVAKNDMAVNYIEDFNHLPPHTSVEFKRFFEDYKELEHKHVEVEKFLGKEDAYKIVQDSINLYKNNFPDNVQE
ncbi:MAG TPA: inorganic diphosphatase [Ignavibacteriales bacterium]|nr:inorganic diphosphatase [Ignavibacteriales bacterium]